MQQILCPLGIKAGTIIYNSNANLNWMYWTGTKWQKIKFTTGCHGKITNSELPYR
jgi:hypothetical protein